MTKLPLHALEGLQPQQVRDLLAAREILLVDVREPEEFAAERIAGAVLYPLSSFDAALLPSDASLPFVFQCGSGKRSAMAAAQHLTAGAVKAFHLAGGIGAWKAAGLPVVRLEPATGRPIST